MSLGRTKLKNNILKKNHRFSYFYSKTISAVAVCVHMCHVVQHLQKLQVRSILKRMPFFQGSIREFRDVKIKKMTGLFSGEIAQTKKIQ